MVDEVDEANNPSEFIYGCFLRIHQWLFSLLALKNFPIISEFIVNSSRPRLERLEGRLVRGYVDLLKMPPKKNIGRVSAIQKGWVWGCVVATRKFVHPNGWDAESILLRHGSKVSQNPKTKNHPKSTQDIRTSAEDLSKHQLVGQVGDSARLLGGLEAPTWEVKSTEKNPSCKDCV